MVNSLPIIRKILSLVTLAVIAIAAFSGAFLLQSSRRAMSVAAEAPGAHSTGSNISCYILGNSICDENGNPLRGYCLDQNRNITDPDGNVIVPAADTVPFSCAERIDYAAADLRRTLAVKKGTDGKITVKPAPISIQLSVLPANVINNTIILESHNPEALSFSDDKSGTISGDSPDAGSSVQSSVTLKPDADGIVQVSLIAKRQGHVIVTVRNVLGNEISRLEFVLLTDAAGSSMSASGSSGAVTGITSSIEPKDSAHQSPGETRTGSDGHEHVFKTRTMSPTARTQGYTLHVCEICGYTYRDEYTDLLTCSHNWRAIKTVPATNETGAYTLFECTLCGQQERRSIQQQAPSVGIQPCRHLICSKTVVPATCKAKGYTLHECLICHNYSYTDEETLALEHDWGDGAVTKSPDCQENGIRTFTCRRCGETKSESLPATAHIWDDGAVTTAPAIDNPGIKTYTCQNCGGTRTENIPALEHDWDEGVITTQPTCISAGIKTYTCRTTGETRTEELPMLEHTIIDEVIPPTNESGGYTRHYCSVCGFELENTDPTDPLIQEHEHDFEYKKEDPSCTEDGYSVYVCGTCGEEKDREVFPAAGHDYEITAIDPSELEEGYIEFRCKRCDDCHQAFHIPALNSFEEIDPEPLDVSAVTEAGNQWLLDNGMEICEEADTEVVSMPVNQEVTQAEAENMMLKTCFDTVYQILEMRDEVSSLTPAFNCVCEVNPETGMAEIHCYYTLLPDAS